MLTYKLAPAIQVGDMDNRIDVSSLKLTSVAINFEDAYRSHGVAVLSVCLVDTVSGYPINIVYQDAPALALWEAMEAETSATIFSKLIADAKLPAGALRDDSEPATPSN